MATPPVDDGMRSRLREARRGAGLYQRDVAERLGVSRRAVHEWEAGTRRPHAKLPELAALYGVSTSYLLTGAEEAAVELRELRQKFDELYDLVIALAEKTAENFEVVLDLLTLDDPTEQIEAPASEQASVVDPPRAIRAASAPTGRSRRGARAQRQHG